VSISDIETVIFEVSGLHITYKNGVEGEFLVMIVIAAM
jgi:hypothetical protein